ncbi:MAG: PfkB family carbohydrate kinase [Gaiellaceae bacterium]
MKLAVVGHVEWVEFARVERVPAPGEIVQATETWAEAGGGGAVAAAQLARLAGGASFFTVLGDDELGTKAREQLERQGVTVHADVRPGTQRRAFTFVDASAERTITLLGPKLAPRGPAEGSMPWEELETCDGVYFVSGGPVALRIARRARVLVAAARGLETLRRESVALDALVGSGRDDAERYVPGDLDPAPKLVVTTAGALGGWAQPGGPYEAAEPPGPRSDAYGCGDAFAAGLTFALAEGRDSAEAVAFAARCGAAAVTGRGAYGGLIGL